MQATLVAKGILRKVEPREGGEGFSPTGGPSPIHGGVSPVATSPGGRPGSAYVRVAIDPMRPPTAVDRSGRAVGGYAGVTRVSTPAGSVDAALAMHAAAGEGSWRRRGSAASLSLGGSGPIDPLAGDDGPGSGAGAGRSSRPPLPTSLSSLHL